MEINENMQDVLAELKKQYEDRKKEPRHSGIIALENKIKRYENYIKIMEDTKCKETSTRSQENQQDIHKKNHQK